MNVTYLKQFKVDDDELDLIHEALNCWVATHDRCVDGHSAAVELLFRLDGYLNALDKRVEAGR